MGGFFETERMKKPAAQFASARRHTPARKRPSWERRT